jgi:hypothetical protein
MHFPINEPTMTINERLISVATAIAEIDTDLICIRLVSGKSKSEAGLMEYRADLKRFYDELLLEAQQASA